MVAVLGSCTSREVRPGDILLISVDTLRPDHMGAEEYARRTTPELERLFRDGASFERAYATSSFTTASMVSVLSGTLPQQHGVRTFDQLLPDDTTLVTELLPESYQTAAFVSNGVLSDRGIGMASRFDHFDDTVGRRPDTHRLERSASATTDAVLEWLATTRDPDRPLFLWVHYMDPHEPYAPPEDVARQLSGDSTDPVPVVRHRERHPDIAPEERIAAYDAEIAYVDREIGRLVRGFGDDARLDDSLLLFTADHGETLAERKRWFVHAHHVFEEQVRVPLLLRGPGVEPGRREELASGLDLLPTMLAFAGAPIPELRGRDLRLPGGPAPAVFVESVHNFDGNQWRAAITPTGKWLVRLRRKEPRVVQRGYWDLVRDPGETRLQPWPEQHPISAELLDLVASDPDPAGMPQKIRRGVLSKENAEILRALGYIE